MKKTYHPTLRFFICVAVLFTRHVSSSIQDSIVYAQLPFTPFNDHLSNLINRIDGTNRKHEQSHDIPALIHAAKIQQLFKQLNSLKHLDSDDRKSDEPHVNKIQYIQQQLDQDILLSWRNQPLYHHLNNPNSPLYISKGFTTKLTQGQSMQHNVVAQTVQSKTSGEFPFQITLISHPIAKCFDKIIHHWSRHTSLVSEKTIADNKFNLQLKRILEDTQKEEVFLTELKETIRKVLKNDNYENLEIDMNTLHKSNGYGCSNIQWNLLKPSNSHDLVFDGSDLSTGHETIDQGSSIGEKLRLGEDSKLTPLLVLSQFDLVLVADEDITKQSSLSSSETIVRESVDFMYSKSLTTLQLQMSLSFADMMKESSPDSSLSSLYQTEVERLHHRRERHLLLEKHFPLLIPYLNKVNSLDLEMYRIASQAIDIHSKHINQRSKTLIQAMKEERKKKEKKENVYTIDTDEKRSTKEGWMSEIIAIYGDVGNGYPPRDDICNSQGKEEEDEKNKHPLFQQALNILRTLYHPYDGPHSNKPSSLLQSPSSSSSSSLSLQGDSLKVSSDLYYDVANHHRQEEVQPPFFTYTEEELERALENR